MASDWTDGVKLAFRDDANGFFWITIQKNGEFQTHPNPCKYDKEHEIWYDMAGFKVKSTDIVAHRYIKQPLDYGILGHGFGYFLRATTPDTQEKIYGFGLNPINWTDIGYDTPEKAISALRRLRRLDIKDGAEADLYEVIDAKRKVIFTLPKKNKKPQD